jgi:beta-glucanase (GH16 family)
MTNASRPRKASRFSKTNASLLRRVRQFPASVALLAVLTALIVLAAPLGCDRENAQEYPQDYELVWQDDFEGPAGQSPDTTKWRFDTGTDWGNAQLEYDTARPENASLDGDGNLAITARKETYMGCAYTSARMITWGHFEQAYGKFEARIRLPLGQGLWPAFWLLGADFGSVGWPDCGEIDIMEYRGQEPNIVQGSLHGPGYYGGSAITRRYILDGAGFNVGFHVFAIEWSEDRITYAVDGRLYLTITQHTLPGGGRWVFNHPFFIILNVAVGGHFVGPPTDSTTFPQMMLVDWVRVYRRV